MSNSSLHLPLFLSLLGMLSFMGMGIIAPVLPLYGQSFGVNSFMVGSLITVFGLARIITNIPGGGLSERFGRRNSLLFGTGFLGITSFLCAYAFSFWSLFFYRFLQGVSSAIIITATMASLADSTEKNQREG